LKIGMEHQTHSTVEREDPYLSNLRLIQIR